MSEGEIVEALARLREHYAEGFRGVVLREVAGGFTLATDPMAERAAGGCSRKPRTPPLTRRRPSASRSSPTCSRSRGRRSPASAAWRPSRPSATLLERGLIEESGRSQFGAVLYRTTALFQKLFGLSGLDALPDPAAFDPSPEEEGELRERLLRAGEQRTQASPGSAS